MSETVGYRVVTYGRQEGDLGIADLLIDSACQEHARQEAGLHLVFGSLEAAGSDDAPMRTRLYALDSDGGCVLQATYAIQDGEAVELSR